MVDIGWRYARPCLWVIHSFISFIGITEVVFNGGKGIKGSTRESYL